MNTVTGKVTDVRAELDYLREHPEVMSKEHPEITAYNAAVDRIKAIYAMEGTIKKAAKRLRIGKRTLERAMRDHPDVGRAIDAVRAACGR